MLEWAHFKHQILFSVSFFNSEIYFCRYFILFTSLVLIRGVTSTRIAQLYSGFGPCRFWVLKCWRMPKAHDCWHSRKIHSIYITIIILYIIKHGTAMLDTEIPQSCETHEYHNHMRYWNSTTMGGTGIPQPWETLKYHIAMKYWNLKL